MSFWASLLLLEIKLLSRQNDCGFNCKWILIFFHLLILMPQGIYLKASTLILKFMVGRFGIQEVGWKLEIVSVILVSWVPKLFLFSYSLPSQIHTQKTSTVIPQYRLHERQIRFHQSEIDGSEWAALSLLKWLCVSAHSWRWLWS